MRALTGQLLLAAWDRGVHRHPVYQGLAMLALALPEVSFEQIAELSLCENNLLLLQLHAISFGPAIEAFATCSQCGAHLEVYLPVAELIDRQQAAISSVPEEWTDEGQLYRLRPLTSSDLLSVLDAATSAEAEQAILQRCTTAPASELLRERFERLNQMAEISCVVECPECSSRVVRDLNLAQFLFRLVDRGAKRLLREIHELAWAYGWSEEAILAMSTGRRGAYLEMLHA
jgi:hypothetical protein